MAKVKANGIEIEYEAVGNRNDPTLLLVMGLGAQLTIWPDSLVEGLAAKGFHVVRFDNRDVGLSSDFGAWGLPNIPDAIQKVMSGQKVDSPYHLKDMAADAVGLLDALGVDRAHMVGASMGGMIVQILAAQYPERTRSMVSIYSTSGRPGLPPGKPEALAMLGSQPEGNTREDRVLHGMKLRRVIGSPAYPMPEPELRAFVERNVDRRWYPEGAARHYLSVIASGDRVEMLKTVKVPTLVLHGEEDPLLPVECGRDVARLVPGAAIDTYPGWGHDFPKELIPTLVDRIGGFCKAAS
ncbi:Pimeloyl-ACP methyl ester carboxylesterase [Enhydrobacter aerosaccus]|uniref:Pimeloyl-ACP methyl ester carboxylesterase n=1 Tax=Enhydrobacter aerosaccus TaxID=225324 RepID=A0A1T4JU73_9HYPH|nr:alpha/beta fold hydrolase [Enhydrobacter aerosaccus]SJZ33693.1 Pimeloyl-ACP methyl ester carboxylesterase [Enhydrobacter aerosaccus]